MMQLPILLATALRVFVTPTGAGDMSGTSWATAMSSIAAAVAAVGESADGGEVWVQGGKYDVGTTMTSGRSVRSTLSPEVAFGSLKMLGLSVTRRAGSGRFTSRR